GAGDGHLVRAHIAGDGAARPVDQRGAADVAVDGSVDVDVRVGVDVAGQLRLLTYERQACAPLAAGAARFLRRQAEHRFRLPLASPPQTSADSRGRSIATVSSTKGAHSSQAMCYVRT